MGTRQIRRSSTNSLSEGKRGRSSHHTGILATRDFGEESVPSRRRFRNQAMQRSGRPVSLNDAQFDAIQSRKPAVLKRIDGWGWQDGLRPETDAPVWPMDAFRDRFLEAFSR